MAKQPKRSVGVVLREKLAVMYIHAHLIEHATTNLNVKNHAQRILAGIDDIVILSKRKECQNVLR